MPVNINDPEYVKAEIWFHEAKTIDEQLLALNKMISHAPGHKGAENLRQQLTTRRKKLELALEKKKKSGKSNKIGIRKDEMQAVLVGKTNSGKSSLLNLLTNASPKISQHKFTTNQPAIGMMSFATTSIQLIEIPATDSEFYDKGIVYTADTVLIIANSLEDLDDLIKILRTNGKKIIVINKTDLLSENEKRKLKATLKSKYRDYEFVLISTKTKENMGELKDKLFQSFGKLRVYTKEPGKEVDKKRPMIMEPGDTIKDVAKKVHKTLLEKFKFAKVWGPSSKFPGMTCGLKHKIKDMDIVELHTR